MSRTPARWAAIALSVALLSAAVAARPQDAATQPATLPSTQPAAPAVAVRQALAMVSAFLAGDVSGFRGLATPRLNDQFRDDLLGRLPGRAREEHGALVGFGEGIVRYDRVDPSLSIVLVPAFFERGTLSFSLVVTAGGEISGFRISSFNARGDAVAPPPGVDPERFSEATLELGGPEAGRRRVTLSLPVSEEPVPAVVVVGVPEPHNRNESLGARHIFRDLAQGLASGEIAVLRFEEDVAGPPRADSARLPAMRRASEVVAALDVLRGRPEVDTEQIYLLAHGFGGVIAARAVAEDGGRTDRADPPVAGLVLAAVPARRALDVAVAHADVLAKLDGRILPDEQALVEETIAIRATIRGGGNTAVGPGLHARATLEDWSVLDSLEAPAELEAARRANPQARVLLIHGGRDLQVTAADLAAWRERLAEPAGSTILVLPELDHVLSAGQGLPSPFDYTRPRPVAGELVLAIADWIRPDSTTRPATQPSSEQGDQLDRS